MKKILCLILAILCCVPHILVGMEAQNITELSADVIKIIAENCRPCDRAALRQTCERFRRVIENQPQELRALQARNMTNLVKAMPDFIDAKDATIFMSCHMMDFSLLCNYSGTP